MNSVLESGDLEVDNLIDAAICLVTMEMELIISLRKEDSIR